MNAVEVYRSYQRARSKVFSLAVAPAFASFGRRSVLSLPVRLDGVGGIAVGSGVSIGAGSWLQGSAGSRPTLVIGDGVSISGTCTLSAQDSVVIEDRVLMARNVYIADHQHRYHDTTRAVKDQGDDVAPVVVGYGAWLGHNVVVRPGVRIGRGAVVAANSVVTQDVPDHCVAAGAPARIVRRFG